MHAAKNRAGDGSITREQRKRWTRELNDAYDKHGFTFTLMGYDEVVNDHYSICGNSAVDFMKSQRTPGTGPNVLHVYFCNTHALKSFRGGFAYLPPVVNHDLSLDGVVVMSPSPGLNTPRFSDDTLMYALVHETGTFDK